MVVVAREELDVLPRSVDTVRRRSGLARLPAGRCCCSLVALVAPVVLTDRGGGGGIDYGSEFLSSKM